MSRNARQTLLSVAAVLSLAAAAIHGWVAPEHFAEWWGYGLFFLVATVAQALYAVVLLRSPTETVLRVGIVGNLAIIVVWVVTRTLGIPLFGPEAGEVEAVGQIDMASKLVEVLLIALLITLLRTAPEPPRQTMGGAV